MNLITEIPLPTPKKPQRLTDRLRQELEANDELRMNLVIDSLLNKAQDGDLTAIKLIFDRMDGQVSQVIEVNYNELQLATSDDLMAKLQNSPIVDITYQIVDSMSATDEEDQIDNDE